MAEKKEPDKTPVGPVKPPVNNGKALTLKDLVKLRLEQETSLPDDDEAMKRWPTIWHLLTSRHPTPETVVEPARISIRLGVGCWLVTLNSSDLRIGLEASAPTLAEAFDRWEEEAHSSKAKWKVWGRKEPEVRKVQKRK